MTTSPDRAVLQEGHLFAVAEQVLLEVLGRVRPQDADVVVPPFLDGDPPRTLADVVEAQRLRDAGLPHELGVPAPSGTVAGGDAATTAEAACRAALEARDGDAVLDRAGPPVTVREHLLREAVQRSLVAHYVAASLGSTACPLPEELARPLWELTAPQADAWRRLGWFHAPLPLPPHVSWRDRFLLTAGHPPHPVEH